jgi:gliding motility-associated-like protein
VATLSSSDGDNIFCAGTSVTFTAGGGTNYNFRVDGVTVQNSPTVTYTTNILTNGQVVDVIVSNASACTSVSAQITNTVTALPTPGLTSSDADNVFCAGTSITFTATGGTGYNFRINGASVQNGASATYTTSSLVNGQVVDVIVTNAAGCSATSTGITNTVNALPVPGLSSSDADNIFCTGTGITFTATGGTGYNFRINGTSVQSGATGTYSTSTLVNGQVIDVVVSNASGCSATSAGITNSVTALPTPGLISSDADNIFCTGTSITFTATGGTGYNFRINGASVQNGASATYTTSSMVNGQVVDVIVTNAGGCIATSTGITNTVNALPVPGLSSSDADNIFCSGTGITFTATGGIGYNFRVNGTSVQSGATATYSTSTLVNGQVVDVVVSNVSGCSATSTGITNAVTALPSPGLTSSDADNIFCTGTSITFTATGGTGYNFRINGASVQNGASATFTSSSLVNGQVVDVIVTNAGGCSATSTGITNTVNALPVPGLSSSDADNIFCSGTGITFTATGGTGYNFRINGTSVQNGASATYSTSALVSGQVVDVVVTNAGGCAATTAGITNTVLALPVTSLTSSDPDNSFCSGTSITFTATGGTTYNFRVGGVSVQSGASASYTTSSLLNGQVVDVVTTNSNGCSATSTGIANTVNPIPVPVLTSSDPDNIICSGTSITLTASGGTNYNFRVAGISVQNGVLSVYTTTSLLNGQVADVIVTNASGCSATSAGKIFFVNPVPFMLISTPVTCSIDLTTYSFAVSVSSGTVTSTSGTVTNMGSNVWSVTGIASGTNVVVRVVDGNGCENTLNITAPDCTCPVVTAPVSGGNKSYCTASPVPVINASVLTGQTVDWYSAASGGTPLASTTLTFTPAAAGTFYAETRVLISGCVSNSRTAIVVTMDPLPLPGIISSDTDNTFCSGTSLTFTASGGTNYNFRIAGISIQNGTSATFTTSSLVNGQVVDVIVTNLAGCSATSAGITNNVSELPVPVLTSSDANNSFCSGTSVTFTASGGAAYNFRVNGVSVQNSALATYTSGTITNGQIVDVIVTNTGGCAATSSGITNTVNSPPAPVLISSDDDNLFCSGTPITFTSSGGITYNFRVSGLSVQNGSQPSFTTSLLTTGQTVDVIVTYADGCNSASQAITNTVNTVPVAAAGTGGNECDLSFIFSAKPSVGTGAWSYAAGPGTLVFTPNENSPTATVTVSNPGTYTFTWTEVNGQCRSSQNIVVNFYQQPVANSGTGGNNCGSEFLLNAVPGIGIGTWTKISGPGTAIFTPDANTPGARVTVNQFGTYSFRWTLVNGTCTSSANVNVVFLQMTGADAGIGGSECDKDFKLNALPGPGIGTWTKLTGPGTAIFTPNAGNPTATVTVDVFGDYEFAWTETNAVCTSSDKVAVSFHGLPAINAGSDQKICEGKSAQLNALGTGTFLWSPANLLDDKALSNPLATPVVSTFFKVILTDVYGCKNSDSVRVEVWKQTVADAGPDQNLDYKFETGIHANILNGDKGVWSLVYGSGKIIDTISAVTTVTDLSLGKNTLIWSVSNGVCPVSRDYLFVNVNDLIIPTIITPNMDGKNDYFVIRGIETLGKTELIIFNRRGVLVYKNAGYDNKWDGVDENADPLINDTYFYVLTPLKGKPFKGFIVIQR